MVQQEGGIHAGEEHHSSQDHPTPRFLVNIAIVLAIITAVEVALHYIDAVDPILVPLLVILSAIKFAWVCWYFMHLKWDNRMLTWIFVAGFFIALAVFIAVWIMMNFHQVDVFFSDLTA